MERVKIKVSGMVQGVGFRPFVYRLAHRYGLVGWVQNDAAGIQAEIEGRPENLTGFLADLKAQAPPQAVIMKLLAETVAPKDERGFYIKKSQTTDGRTALVLPDIATCPDCQQELGQAGDRRFRYPFTNCTNCGPRYSIIQDLPYDRAATTMSVFRMCPSCQAEYNDPRDRRFHAQPNACPVCGPAYQLLTASGQAVEGEAFAEARKRIAQGAILAVKGLGGYHLVCNAADQAAVAELRERKGRVDKPFAVMFGDLGTARLHCTVSDAEETLLSGAIRPIVLLAKNPQYGLAQAVAPGNPTLGAMLPYAPVHWILLEAGDAYVMTSGNVSDEPIAYEDQEAQGRLAGLVDYFLIHNRPIHSRVDDSVARIAHNKPFLLRRGRGVAPAPIQLAQAGPPVLACGGEVKNTFCLTKGTAAFMSAHIGDLENVAALASYTGQISHYQALFAIQPEFVAHDLHPDYLSTKYAQTLDLPLLAIQHHHAHIASVLAEHGLNEKVIGVAFDGTGYGTDGLLWGSEFMLADCQDFIRMAHSRYFALPGGMKAIQEPWRQAAWLLQELYGDGFAELPIPFCRQLPDNWPFILQAAAKGINSPLACGAGRLFDMAAAILGIRCRVHYEGQAAVELESAAAGATGWLLPYHITGGPVAELDFRPAFAALVQAVQRGENPAGLAAAFHMTLAAATVDMIRRIHHMTGIRKVAFSGGVFQNMTLLGLILERLDHPLTPLLNRQVPANDGGLALGQAAVARERSKQHVSCNTGQNHSP